MLRSAHQLWDIQYAGCRVSLCKIGLIAWNTLCYKSLRPRHLRPLFLFFELRSQSDLQSVAMFTNRHRPVANVGRASGSGQLHAVVEDYGQRIQRLERALFNTMCEREDARRERDNMRHELTELTELAEPPARRLRRRIDDLANDRRRYRIVLENAMANVIDFSPYDAGSGLHSEANELYQGVADGTIDHVVLKSYKWNTHDAAEEYYSDSDVCYLLKGIRSHKVIMDYGHLQHSFVYRDARAADEARLRPFVMDEAARLIQKYWKAAAYDPTRSLCISRLQKRFEDLQIALCLQSK